MSPLRLRIMPMPWQANSFCDENRAPAFHGIITPRTTQAGATPQLRRRRTETLGGRNLMDRNSLPRRQFIHIGTGAVAATAAAKVTLLEPNLLSASARAVPPSDTVRFASIGTGIRGCERLQASLRVPRIDSVAVCDLHHARHHHAND